MKHNSIKIIIAITVLLNLNIKALGQSTTNFAQYVLNPMSINPAHAGGQDALNISLFYGRRWTGIKGSPKSVALSADAPFLNKKLGLGLMLANEEFGVSKQNEITTNYAFKIFSSRSTLSLGLGASMKLTNSTYSDLTTLDLGDEIYLQDSRNYTLANFSFGVNYAMKYFFVGFSIPQLLNYNFNIKKDEYLYVNDFNRYRYLLNTGYKIKAGNNLTIVPSLLLQYSKFNTSNNILYDLNTLICYQDILCLGGSYQNDRSFATLLQINPNKQISIAYSFNIETSQLNRYTNGSHQIILKYIFKYKVYAPNSLIF